jgi:hypothetical protein
MSEFMGSRFN